MARCPKCKSKIEILNGLETVEQEVSIFVNNDSEIESAETISGSYHCPECHAELFTDRQDAYEFLDDNQEVKIETIKQEEKGIWQEYTETLKLDDMLEIVIDYKILIGHNKLEIIKITPDGFSELDYEDIYEYLLEKNEKNNN